jgi:hypothetical protein
VGYDAAVIRIQWALMRSARRYPSSHAHSEPLANLLIPLRLNSTLFSECALKTLRWLADFDSTIGRFESSRP